MERKIIQQSPTSLGITLPSKWTDRWNLKKGDVVIVNENDGKLLVSPIFYKPPEKKIEIDAHLYKNLSRRVFDNLSKRGYDEIKVKFKDEREIKPIKETLRVEAVMFEIIKKDENYIILKSISEINYEELNNILNRIVYLIREKVNVLNKYIDTLDKSLLDDLLEHEKTNNRLCHICMRAIHKQPQMEDSYIRYTFIWALEKLANNFKFFAKANPTRFSNELKKQIKDTLSVVYSITDLYFKYDSKYASEIYEKRKLLVDDIMKKMKNSSDSYLLHLLLNLLEMSLYILGLIVR